MDPLREQVAQAQRRLVWEQFLARAGRCLFVAMIVAAVAITVPRVLVINVLPGGWDAWCFFGGVFFGLLAAGVWTWVSHRSTMDAAIEIDRRFELRERVASSLTLSESEAASDAGRALIDDALRAVSRIEVGERFRVRSDRRAWWPLVPAALAVLLVALVDIRQATSSADTSRTDETQQVQNSVETARKEMAKRRQQAEAQKLTLAEGLFDRIEKQTGELAKKKDVDRTEAAVKLNDLAKQLEERRRQLGGADEMKRQFQGMKQLSAGPADKAAQALKKGDFQTAQQEIEKLQQQMQNGDLDDKAQQQLADQLNQMQQKIEAAVQAHQQAQADLQQQIDQQRRQGDLAEAGKLQQQLDQIQQQQPLMDQLNQFGIQIGQCRDGCKQGNASQSNNALSQMAAQLGQMQQQANETQMLDDALAELQQAKSAMACSQCNGAGCQECQGGGGGKVASGSKEDGQSTADSNQPSGQPGRGIGTGQGPELMSGNKNAGDPQYQDVQVRPSIGAGPGVYAGKVDGPNIKGQAVEAIKQEMASQAAVPAEPLTSERLPRTRREQAEEYFQLLREGQ
jgi:hypothetical protein